MSSTLAGLAALALLPFSPLVGAGLAGAVPAATAQAGFPDGSGPPVSGIEVVEPTGTRDLRVLVAGRPVIVQSPAQPVGDRRDAWTCAVDPGDGTTGETSAWRGRESQPEQPCALQHTYDRAGTYTATVTVTDPAGRAVTGTRRVDVAAPAPRTTTARQGEPFRVDAVAGVADGAGDGPVESLDGTCLTSAATVTCFRPGPARLLVGGSPLDVDVANVGPRPGPVRVTRRHLGGRRSPARVVRTGDAVRLMVPHGDPGLTDDGGPAVSGERVRCAATFGDGARSAYTLEDWSTCGFDHSWTRPGWRWVQVRATDAAGERGTASRLVRVLFRAARARAVGRLDDRSRLRSWLTYDRSGLRAGMRLRLGDGSRVVSRGRPRFSVTDGEVSWTGATDRPGVRYELTVTSRRADAARLVLWSPDGSTPTQVRTGAARTLRATGSLGRAGGRTG